MSLLELTRRQVLKVLGSGFLVAVLPAWASARLQRGQQAPQNVDAWLHIGPDGMVTVLTGKVEVGQNARTSFTAAVAEELRVQPHMVKVVMGDTDLVPYDRGTFGSQSTPQMVPQLRRAAATVREALVDMAAEKLSVSRESLIVAEGKVSGCGGTLTFGELVGDKKITNVIPREVALTPPDKWTVMGRSLSKIGSQEITNGSHKYSTDVTAPGMLHAKVLRAPSLGAKLVSLDDSKARAMDGVKVVRDGDFVAVAAPSLRQATAARDALDAKWQEDSKVSTGDLYALFGVEQPSEGTSAYQCAYIAHAPLEPRAAFAHWDGERITVHTGTQRPFGVKTEVAEALKLSEEKVRVIVPDTGSGYGGKHFGDAAIEAARITKALGVPIRLVWTRAEEFNFAYFRPGGIVHIMSELSSDNKIVRWEFDNFNSGGSALETPYSVQGKREQFHRVDSPLRQGSYRGLAATFNNFARESEMDALARKADMDPVAFRLAHLTDPRLRAVLEACAEKFGWKPDKMAPGHGVGIACGTEKGSFVATAVEVKVTDEIKVVRAVTAYECGKIINPAHVQQQVDGAVVQGLGGALFERIVYDQGKNQTAAFANYRVPRFSDVPQMETVLLDRPDLPSVGAGETPIMAVSPAIAGAVEMATGQRLTSMPLQLSR